MTSKAIKIVLILLSCILLLVVIDYFRNFNSPDQKQVKFLKSLNYPADVSVKYSTQKQCSNEPCNPGGTRAEITATNPVLASQEVSNSLAQQGFIKTNGAPCSSNVPDNTGSFCQSYNSPSQVTGCNNLGFLGTTQQNPLSRNILVLYCFQ